MIGEEDAKHVPDFPLVPVGAGEDRADGLDGGQFVCVGLDADARVETKGQQVVHNLEIRRLVKNSFKNRVVNLICF